MYFLYIHTYTYMCKCVHVYYLAIGIVLFDCQEVLSLFSSTEVNITDN